MHIIEAFAVGLVIGGGLVWAFRGWIQHRKDAAAAAAQQTLGNVAKKL